MDTQKTQLKDRGLHRYELIKKQIDQKILDALKVSRSTIKALEQELDIEHKKNASLLSTLVEERKKLDLIKLTFSRAVEKLTSAKAKKSELGEEYIELLNRERFDLDFEMKSQSYLVSKLGEKEYDKKTKITTLTQKLQDARSDLTKAKSAYEQALQLDKDRAVTLAQKIAKNLAYGKCAFVGETDNGWVFFLS